MKTLCVDAFPSSTSRASVFAGVTAFLHELSAAGVVGQVWLDGSFITKKLDPKDCDLVLAADGVKVFQEGSPALHDLLKRRFSTERAALKASHLCDAYVFADFPVIHTSHSHTIARRAYWQRQFGFDRSGKPKGLAAVNLPVTT